MKGENEAHKSVAHQTLMSHLINSDLPAQEKGLTRLGQEAGSMVGAAIETTKGVLSLAIFHVFDNADIHHLLKRELEAAFPDVNRPPALSQLETLPYLNAVILEGMVRD